MTERLKELEYLTLHWPTDYFTYTQHWGARPEYYGQFGLPGHEGVDCRAPSGTNIYATIYGKVIRVQKVENGNAYGIHVRIETVLSNGEVIVHVYAHLQEAHVVEGQIVSTGQRIGLADNTGNSSGSHLHFGLKLRGACERGLSNMPYNYDYINPEPYLIKQHVGKPKPIVFPDWLVNLWRKE